MESSSDTEPSCLSAISPEVQPDWCHLQETTQLLLLATAQIELSLTDGDHNVTGLGALFTDMASHLARVNSHLQTQEATPDEILQDGESLMTSVQKGIVAFQCYDRISQRLNHVIAALMLLENMLSDEAKRNSPDAWQRLLAQIQQQYSLECERQMFEALLTGEPLHKALQRYRDEHLNQPEENIELF